MSQKSIAAALEILRTNDRGEFSVPTHGLYPVQFNWDSAFASLGYVLFDPERAYREVELLLEAQWQDGMVPTSSSAVTVTVISQDLTFGPRGNQHRPAASLNHPLRRQSSGD